MCGLSRCYGVDYIKIAVLYMTRHFKLELGVEVHAIYVCPHIYQIYIGLIHTYVKNSIAPVENCATRPP